MRLKIFKFLGKIKDRLLKKSRTIKKDQSLESELLALRNQIFILKSQIESLNSIVKEQSTIIVAVTKIQANISQSVDDLERKLSDENCFYIKVPMSSNEISN